MESLDGKLNNLINERKTKKEKLNEDINMSKNFLKESVNSLIEVIRRKEGKILELYETYWNNFCDDNNQKVQLIKSKIHHNNSNLMALNNIYKSNNIVNVN